MPLQISSIWDGFSLQENFTIFLMVCFVFEKIETFLDSFAIIKMFIVANGRILNTQFWPCVHTGYRDTNLCMCFCQKIEWLMIGCMNQSKFFRVSKEHNSSFWLVTLLNWSPGGIRFRWPGGDSHFQGPKLVCEFWCYVVMQYQFDKPNTKIVFIFSLQPFM